MPELPSTPAPGAPAESAGSPPPAAPMRPIAAAAGSTRAPASPALELDTRSAMAPRFNWPFRRFARRFFDGFGLGDGVAERLRALEAQGSVVYVMRYASRLDYFLFNTLFLRERLRLAAFANGIRFDYYRPLFEALRFARAARRAGRGGPDPERDRAQVRRITAESASIFLFLRTARPRWSLRRSSEPEGRAELDLLEELVQAAWHSGRKIHVVPIALFWRKGPRTRRRFLNLFYGSAQRPSDLAKVLSFVTTYRDLAVKVGESIDLQGFVERRRSHGPQDVARMVRRSILTFLYREEKVVEGPTLRPLSEVERIVLDAPDLRAAIRAQAEQGGRPLAQVEDRARRMFREIAANMNSTFLAVLDVLVGALLRRLFASIEVVGLERVAQYAKRHPLVLVPSHRSYFDFLILSVLFYDNYLVPPHIAARENMAFGPFGLLWRRAGAFFLRRSFDDPLYKQVFRAYLAYLMAEGVTQEFFIEGGRSRTGKTLPPKLGILGWELDAFLATARRDLFFVPIGISYERLVEEGSMVEELEGAAKQDESMLGLIRARKFLQRRFGSVHVRFGEPISLAGALGARRERFAIDEGEATLAERRDFVAELGNRLVERINWSMVPTATAVASCAMLADRSRGVFRSEVQRRMGEIVALLALQDVRLTPALERDVGDFGDSLGTMLRTDLLRSVADPRGEILYFEESKRRALDFYRNSLLHFLATPSLLARRILRPAAAGDLYAEIGRWLEIFYREFFTPRGEVLAAHLGAFLDHFEREGWIERGPGLLRASEKGAPRLRLLAAQSRPLVEAYYAALVAVARLGEEAAPTRKELCKTAAAHFEREELLGEVERREACNPVVFGHALDWLCDEGVLALQPGASRSEAAYRRGPAFAEAPRLRDRLAAHLGAG